MTDINPGAILEALNDKVDRDFNNMNPSQSAKTTIIGYGIPDYSSQASITLPYTATEDGLFSWRWGTTARGAITINGIEVCVKQGASNDDNYATDQFLVVGAGDIIATTGTAPSNTRFYKFKGNV